MRKATTQTAQWYQRPSLVTQIPSPGSLTPSLTNPNVVCNSIVSIIYKVKCERLFHFLPSVSPLYHFHLIPTISFYFLRPCCPSSLLWSPLNSFCFLRACSPFSLFLSLSWYKVHQIFPSLPCFPSHAVYH